MSKSAAFVALVLALAPLALRADPVKTVCTVTVNSDDEKETFRKRLPPGKYRFVELLEHGREDWLRSSCQKKVQCDVLIVSGHFNAGETFYSDKVDVEEHLKVDELERASCSNSCPGLFDHLKEVYLFGCESLNPDPTKYSSSYGESGRERMRRIFAHVPSIYGFYSSAPVGPTAAMLLDRYFDAGGGPFATGRPNERLLRMFSRNHMTRVTGLTDSEPGAGARKQICEFFDDRHDAGGKVRFVHDLLRRDPDAGLRFLDRVEHLFASFTDEDRASPAFARALAEMSADDATRDRYLALERASRSPATRARMIALGATFGWLSRDAQRSELVAMMDELFTRRALGFAEADLVCSLNQDRLLDGTVAKLRPPAAAGAGADAALACLGSSAARERILRTLASGDEKDVQIAQLYLRYHPVADGPELRALADEVSRMPPTAAQIRALGALARLHIADRGVLDELAQAFARSKSVNVQRAIAEVFIRSDQDALAKHDLAGVLREHRLKSPDGSPDLIDTLIRQLAS